MFIGGGASTYKYQLGVYNVFTFPESEFATVVKVYQAAKEYVANAAKVVFSYYKFIIRGDLISHSLGGACGFIHIFHGEAGAEQREYNIWARAALWEQRRKSRSSLGDWDSYSRLREHLCGVEGVPWERVAPITLVLLSSLPSGDPEIVSIRNLTSLLRVHRV